ncbi:homoserine kinase [Leptolyngbya sp. AN02str]|uniref:homoserine kinase n=1 Tax=Leptolyngbya sp. AN02str TaxID=3423363 RepID=UPI003D31C819
MLDTVTLTVPGTTANIGPGFDCLGAALTLGNQFQFSRLTTGQVLQIDVSGVEAERVGRDEDNLAYQAFVKLYQAIDQAPPAVQISIQLDVPLARGLGSSATAIVGGLVGANALAGSPLSRDEVMQLAIAMEGHPDNVVPALIGGCRLSATQGNEWTICDVVWHKSIVPVVAIPNFELSTAEARRVLPKELSRADAIFNMAHLGLLLRGLETGNAEWLRTALQDRMHQPYRKALIRGYDAVEQGAIASGAYGMVISGAGPTLLALAPQEQAEAVAQAMQSCWMAEGVNPILRILQLNTVGTVIH